MQLKICKWAMPNTAMNDQFAALNPAYTSKLWLVLSRAILPPSKYHLSTSGDIFTCHNLEWGRGWRQLCYWHLLGRHQRCL